MSIPRNSRQPLAHGREVDGEAGHVATLMVGHDEHDTGAAVEVAHREAIDAAGQKGAVVPADGRALVLDERRADLAGAVHEPGRVVAREVLAPAAKVDPHDEPARFLLDGAL